MANNDEVLQEYIHKMYQVQNNRNERPLTTTELKEIALEMGMTESEWQGTQQTFNANLQTAKGYVGYKNWTDAANSYEQATSINPYHIEAVYGAAFAYLELWRENQDEVAKQKSKTYAERCQQIQPGHQASARILSEIRFAAQSTEKSKKTNKLVIIGIVAAIVVVFVLWAVSARNGIITKEEAVTSKWAQVENVYQRRADLIPQLIKVVKSSASFEKETVEALIKAHSESQSVNVNPSNMSEEDLKKFQDKQTQLSSAVQRLVVSSEKYPELKSLQGFRDLQSQLEGSENRITVERKRFNDAVTEYNSTIRTFPNNILGFKKKAYFQTSKDVLKNPELNL